MPPRDLEFRRPCGIQMGTRSTMQASGLALGQRYTYVYVRSNVGEVVAKGEGERCEVSE